jgi:predicted nucleotidyltransferase
MTETKRDIDLLLGSSVRADLVWAFLRYPGLQVSASLLASITRRSLSDIQRNLKILEKIGLVERFSYESLDHNSQWTPGHDFLLVKNHPWIPALRMLLERSIGSLKILSEAVSKIPDIEVAFVFGSFATSEQRPDSDIDLLVIGKHDMATLAEPISEVEKRTGREINYIAYSPDDWRTKFESRNYFVMSLIDSPKIFLIGDSKSLERITVPYLNEP